MPYKIKRRVAGPAPFFAPWPRTADLRGQITATRARHPALWLNILSFLE